MPEREFPATVNWNTEKSRINKRLKRKMQTAEALHTNIDQASSSAQKEFNPSKLRLVLGSKPIGSRAFQQMPRHKIQ